MLGGSRDADRMAPEHVLQRRLIRFAPDGTVRWQRDGFALVPVSPDSPALIELGVAAMEVVPWDAPSGQALALATVDGELLLVDLADGGDLDRYAWGSASAGGSWVERCGERQLEVTSRTIIRGVSGCIGPLARVGGPMYMRRV